MSWIWMILVNSIWKPRYKKNTTFDLRFKFPRTVIWSRGSRELNCADQLTIVIQFAIFLYKTVQIKLLLLLFACGDNPVYNGDIF